MFPHPWKYIKPAFMILAMLLMLTGMMGVPPSPVQAGQIVAAPQPEGVKPPLPEQAASVLVESLSAGRYHTCGIMSDGTLACWGDNSNGQSSPPSGTFIQVSAGDYHTCGLKGDGTIACWGAGTTNTGSGHEFGQSMPPSGTFTQVSAGSWHTCGLKSDGTLACWGNNAHGQSNPPDGTFRQVSAGWINNCGLKSDGTLTCWGDNSLGQSTPPTGTFTQVSAGGWHTCGLKNDSTLACWGLNDYGQTNPPTGTFTQITAGGGQSCGLKSDGTLACWGDNTHGQSNPPAGTFRQVSAGLYHTCGLKSDGSLACWGAGTTNTGVNFEYGQSIPPGGALFGRTQISAGYDHTCLLKSDGTLVCWGDNSYGESSPPAGSFTQVSARWNNTCGLKSDGTLACWGENDEGQSSPPAGIFTQVSAGWRSSSGLKSDGTIVCWTYCSGEKLLGTFIQVSKGYAHDCGLKSDGTLDCKGDNNFGQISFPAGTFTQVSAGRFFNCGIKSDGTLACWGSNDHWQSHPPAGAFTQVSAGEAHACGIRSDGTLTCWGDNSNYQSSPPFGTFTQVSAGGQYTCGLRSDGSVVCWGASPHPFKISGSVGVAGAGATLSYTIAGFPKTATADDSGNYHLWVDYGWSDTVTPSRTGYTFSPVYRSYTNVLSDLTDENYTAANDPPIVVSCLRADPNPTNAASVDFTVTFSEAVRGGDTSDFSLSTTGISGASVTNVSGSGSVRTVTVDTGTGDGTLRLDVTDDDSILDVGDAPLGGSGAGNGDYTGGETYTIDKTAPTVLSILRADPNPTNAASVDFTVTFSETVTGVDASDFSLIVKGISEASISAVSCSERCTNVRTVSVNTGMGNGMLRLTVTDNDSILDSVGNPLGGPGAGNGNFTTGESYKIDKTAPTVLSSLRADPNPTSALSVDFTVAFSEAVTGVDASDFSLSTTGISGASVTNVSGSGTTYTVTAGTGTGDGTLHLDVTDNDSILDSAGNPLGGSGASNGNYTGGQAYEIDKNAPTVVSSLRASSNPTSAASVVFTVTFSESVTGVDTSDFALNTSGVTGASITGVSGSGTTYTVTVNTGSGNGTICLDVVDDDTILDAASNPLNGGYTDGETYTITREFTLTIVSANGTVTKNPNQATYHESDLVQLTATPNAGWSFANWTGDLTSSANPASVIIHGNTTVTANYTQLCYTLTRTHTGSGGDPTAAPSNSNGCSSGQYHYNEYITLTANPASGWAVGSWSGTLYDSSTSTTNWLYMPAISQTVTVNYIQTCYTLTRTHTGNGTDPTAVPTSSSGCSTGQYHYNEYITLTASPTSGWTMGSWTGTASDASNSPTNLLYMPTGNQTVAANYILLCYTLGRFYASSGSNPTAAPTNSSGCSSGQYHAGEVITLTAHPASDWTVGSWLGTDNDLSTSSTNSLTMPSSGHTVTVNYVQTCHTLTRTHTGSGADPSAVPSYSSGCSGGQYHAGEAITLTASPDLNYAVGSWSGMSNNSSTSTTNSLTMPAGTQTVTTNYIQVCYALTRTHTGSGGDPIAAPTNSSGCSSGYYLPGQSITLTASPSIGWTVGSWSGTSNNSSTSTANSLTMPAGTQTVTINYIQICYYLWRTHTGSGGYPTAAPTNSSGCSSEQYHASEYITLTANPASGWTVGSWSGTSNNASTSTTNWLYMPAISQTVTVNYIQTCYTLTRAHTGSGGDPTAAPTNSSGCSSGQYHAGESISLTASPAAGWAVGSWSGTSNNASTSTTNSLTMPAGYQTVTVNYIQTCYTLTRAHTGSGSDPTASPTNSIGCSSGQYHAGESISLTASPAAGWAVGSWSGTNNNASTSTTNSVSMPSGNQTITANYILNTYRIYLPLVIR